MRSRATISAKPTLARSGNRRWCSIIGPTCFTGALAASLTKNTTCGLPMETQPGVCSTGSSRGPTCSSTPRVSMASARGMSRQSRPGAPMSTRTRRSPTRSASSGPASVAITTLLKSEASVSSQATQRVALPQAATSPPSAFQMRMKTSAALSLPAGSMAISWSQPTPVARSAMARTSAPVGAKGADRASTTTKSLPRPFIFRKGRPMASNIVELGRP